MPTATGAWLRTARVQLGARIIGDYIYHPSGAAAKVRDHVMGSKTPGQWYDDLGMAVRRQRTGSRITIPPEEISMSVIEPPKVTPERARYYDKIRAQSLSPLWMVFNRLITRTPPERLPAPPVAL